MQLRTDHASNSKDPLIPRINVAESDDAIDIEAELPGFWANPVEAARNVRYISVESA